MILLAADTSGASCACCLTRDSELLAESFLSVGLTHSQTFMPVLDAMMNRTGIRYEDVDVFAVSVGPGSFTGIRIGVTTIKTMAMLQEKPAVPVSSLYALAYPFFSQENVLVVPVIDARNRRVFTAAYQKEETVIPETAGAVELLFSEITSFLETRRTGRVLFCGDAAETCCKEAQASGIPALACPPFGAQIRPFSVASAAGEIYVSATKKNMDFSAENLLPSYLVQSSAERMAGIKKNIFKDA